MQLRAVLLALELLGDEAFVALDVTTVHGPIMPNPRDGPSSFADPRLSSVAPSAMFSGHPHFVRRSNYQTALAIYGGTCVEKLLSLGN